MRSKRGMTKAQARRLLRADPDFYRRLGSLGGRATAERHPGHHAAAGRKGGLATLERYGPDHLAEIGRRDSWR